MVRVRRPAVAFIYTAGVPTSHLAHAFVFASDLERVAAFYAGAFGMRRENSSDAGFVIMRAFNVGVELGQLFALYVILIGMSYWRMTPNFARGARVANFALAGAGSSSWSLLFFPPSTPSIPRGSVGSSASGRWVS